MLLHENAAYVSPMIPHFLGFLRGSNNYVPMPTMQIGSSIVVLSLYDRELL